MYAINSGNWNIFKFLLSKTTLNLDLQDSDGNTALLLAIFRGQFRMAEYLLKLGANPNIKNENGISPLYESITGKTIDNSFISLLLKMGANPNERLRDYQNAPILNLVALRSTIEITELLLKAGADVSAVDYTMQTAIELLFRYNFKDKIDLFLKYGATLNKSILIYALENDNFYGMYLYCNYINITNKKLSSLEIQRLLHSKKLEDKLCLIFANNVTENTLYYLSKDGLVGWVAKERYRELNG